MFHRITVGIIMLIMLVVGANEIKQARLAEHGKRVVQVYPTVVNAPATAKDEQPTNHGWRADGDYPFENANTVMDVVMQLITTGD